MIYLKPEHKSYSIEQLEYESTQFFSDVGGAAGLLLGVSFTSLFGMIDFLVSSIFANLKVNYNRYVSFGKKKKSEHKRDKYCQVNQRSLEHPLIRLKSVTATRVRRKWMQARPMYEWKIHR